MTTNKIDGATATVNTSTVRESSTTGTPIPPADLHARRITQEAAEWFAFARERSRMAEHTLVGKALSATAFSVQHGAASLAVPSKLVGTVKHQRSLWRIVSEGVEPWAELSIDGRGPMTVSLHSAPLGEIQAKHVTWMRPLTPFGLRVYLSRVTGSSTRGYRLGANVVVAHVGTALAALRSALETDVGASGDGADGDGALSRVPAAALTLVPSRPHASGDGASRGVAARVTRLVPVYPEASYLHGAADDVVLWRDAGVARASVRHMPLWSHSGPEWGYVGAGPSDLARSILVALTARETAEALTCDFAHEVIARVPERGGVLRAADVRGWADAKQASGGRG